ncbi:glycine/betaine ABC transporter substrate-binding protein [Rhodococcus ruber Chol-4]|uniref:Putative ABC transporter substrate-binding protein n=1 Tax=Rhodococcus ruber TaxID=1830 RepID=A0A098BKR3_9NOCA|nr:MULTISPECIES: glycine betaine ABC transporter substrate-binding protein [Rhodococcus]MDO2378357.1 glycine betaine ABC transporter substrate-binding protein [Rhodococcus ruber]NGR06389.1 glycine betaine ABC transporter substrate-binding protein [bacterium SGD-2]RIK14223.1 MAG: glycine/betaine ABC transporter substrate-binding protein [Acidobacteriota bacterium]ATQ28513.1 glycine/betaine ABC transporter substrate-binding protein [Rhodococcus ruber]AWG99919.1 glycine/betaine ABC transporter su
MTARLLSRLAGALLAASTLAACGLGTAGGFVPTGELAGPLQSVEPLDGASISVGSKNFSEGILLGKMAVILLRSAGADVTDLTNIPGSASSRQAQLEGQVDLQWEYTGTAWIAYLGHEEAIPDEREQYEAVRDEDLRENGLVWLPPAPMNNTYGFAATSAEAQRLGVASLSDIANIPVAERTFCVESEFANRNDGLQPMLDTYGIPLGSGVPRENIRTLDTGAIYEATARGDCNFGEVFTTDGRIEALDLTVLEDDRKFFPIYNVAVVVRDETLTENPQIAELFAPVSRKLTDETLIELNGRIDVDGQEPAEVAYDWLVQEGFVE